MVAALEKKKRGGKDKERMMRRHSVARERKDPTALYFKSLRLRTCDNVRAFYGGACTKGSAPLIEGHGGRLLSPVLSLFLSLSLSSIPLRCSLPLSREGGEIWRFSDAAGTRPTATRKIDCSFVDPRGKCTPRFGQPLSRSGKGSRGIMFVSSPPWQSSFKWLLKWRLRNLGWIEEFLANSKANNSE